MDLVKLMKELAKDDPELMKMIEDDDSFIEDRQKYYLKHGYDERKATLKAWDDYWKMAFKRDGVEFSIHKLDVNKDISNERN